MMNLPKTQYFVAENGNTQVGMDENMPYRNNLYEKYIALKNPTRQVEGELLKCSLTSDFFIDPVITPCGFTYEREAVEQRIRSSRTDPVTYKTLTLEQIRPNLVIKQMVDVFIEEGSRLKSDLPRDLGGQEADTKFSIFSSSSVSLSSSSLQGSLASSSYEKSYIPNAIDTDSELHAQVPVENQKMPSKFKPYNEKTEEGFMLDSSMAVAHLCNSASIVDSLFLGGHAVLALEALIDGKYVAIKADISAMAKPKSMQHFWDNKPLLLHRIKYKEKSANYTDKDGCSEVLYEIFKQGGVGTRSSSSRSAEEKSRGSLLINQSNSFAISTKDFRAIQKSIFERQIAFAKAIAESILVADNEVAFREGLLEDAEKVDQIQQEGFDSISINVPGIYNRVMGNGAKYIHYCKVFLTEINKVPDPQIEKQHHLASSFLYNVPDSIFPTLHKLNTEDKLAHNYQKFRISGPKKWSFFGSADEGQSVNCMAWAKSLLEECGIKTTSTNIPKHIF